MKTSEKKARGANPVLGWLYVAVALAFGVALIVGLVVVATSRHTSDCSGDATAACTRAGD